MNPIIQFYNHNKGKIVCAAASGIFYIFLREITNDAYTDGVHSGKAVGVIKGRKAAIKDIADGMEKEPDIFIDMLNKVKASQNTDSQQ